MNQNDFFSELENFDLSKYKGVLKIVAGILAVGLTGYTSVFTVDPEERAVVLRFGKVDREVGQGLHFKLPFFIDQEYKVEVLRQQKLEFGFRSTPDGSETGFSPAQQSSQSLTHESLMLTGGLNVANIEWVTQYTITDPETYLFKVRNVEQTFRDMNEAVMREVVGDRTIDEVLTEGKDEFQKKALDKLRELTNPQGENKAEAYTLGITVDQVILQTVVVPEQVKPAYNEVNQAEQEMKTTILNAEASVEREIPKARGTALKTVEAAEGYAVKRVNEALGAASRFTQVFEEYKKAPNITRQRIYLETMSDIYQAVDRKIIIDENANGVLPLLNVNRER
jgi:membrane protease subunit HflK